MEKSENDVESGVKENVKCVIDEIRQKSEVLKNLEKEGKLKIVGMKYFFEDGRVEKVE